MRDKGRTENVEMRERQRVIEKKKMKKVRERKRARKQWTIPVVPTS